MAARKVIRRKRTAGRKAGRARRKSAAASRALGLPRRLEDLREQVDIVLPEVTARVAALEHLLLDLKLCTMAELRAAREFVRVQEA